MSKHFRQSFSDAIFQYKRDSKEQKAKIRAASWKSNDRERTTALMRLGSRQVSFEPQSRSYSCRKQRSPASPIRVPASRSPSLRISDNWKCCDAWTEKCNPDNWIGKPMNGEHWQEASDDVTESSIRSRRSRKRSKSVAERSLKQQDKYSATISGLQHRSKSASSTFAPPSRSHQPHPCS